jgi:hypothetical protein
VYQRVLARLQYGCSTWVVGTSCSGGGFWCRLGAAEVDVWRVSLGLEKLIVGQHCLCEGLLLLALGSESMGCHAAEGMDLRHWARGQCLLPVSEKLRGGHACSVPGLLWQWSIHDRRISIQRHKV